VLEKEVEIMDPMMQLFFILWMFVLPILAIILTILIPVFWFFIVPKIARTLTWKRFRSCSFHLIADDSGYAYLLATKEEIPEGIVDTKKGWRFLPRPSWLKSKGNPKPKKDKQRVENIMLRKFVWRDMGKPIWFGYAGKVTSANPATLAGLQQEPYEAPNTDGYISNIINYVKALAQPHRRELTKRLEDLKKGLTFKELTIVDPTIIKKLYPKMFTPSQLDAFGTNRETRGMKRAGRQYTPLILGAGFIIALAIIGIVAIMLLK